MGGEPLVDSEGGRSPEDEFRRVMGGLGMGCIAAGCLSLALFRLLQAYPQAAPARLGEGLLYLLIGGAALWAAIRLTPLWRFTFAGVALVMAIAFLSYASGVQGLGSDWLPIYDGTRTGEDGMPSIVAAVGSATMAVCAFLVGDVRRMKRRRSS